MKGLMVWDFEDRTVRTIEIDGEPWFVGKDVAGILGYANSRKAIGDHVDEEDKGVTKCDTLGGMQDLCIVNESGLYSLILSSKLPRARRFKHWVTSEVLPAIRKHGMYAVEELLDNPDFIISAFRALRDERRKSKRLAATVRIQKQQIARMRLKASYCDAALRCKDLVTVNTIAKSYGWSAVRMNAYLHEQGIQYRQGGIWHLYQGYAGKGYTGTRTLAFKGKDGERRCCTYTCWTQKGRLFLYGLLKKNGILPVAERDDAM